MKKRHNFDLMKFNGRQALPFKSKNHLYETKGDTVFVKVSPFEIRKLNIWFSENMTLFE